MAPDTEILAPLSFYHHARDRGGVFAARFLPGERCQKNKLRLYVGQVKKLPSQNGCKRKFYRIRYADRDKEYMGIDELKECIVDYENFHNTGTSHEEPASSKQILAGTWMMKYFSTPHEADVIEVPRKEGEKYRIRYLADDDEEDVTEEELERMVEDRMKRLKSEDQVKGREKEAHVDLGSTREIPRSKEKSLLDGITVSTCNVRASVRPTSERGTNSPVRAPCSNLASIEEEQRVVTPENGRAKRLRHFSEVEASAVLNLGSPEADDCDFEIFPLNRLHNKANLPLYHVEYAKSDRDKCSATQKSKVCGEVEEITTIGKNEIRVGSFDQQEGQGDYGLWHHLQCWKVPCEIWLGLPDPDTESDPQVFVQALLRLERFSMGGFAQLSEQDKLKVVQHVANKKHWA